MKIHPTKQWCKDSAQIEGGAEVGCGALPPVACSPCMVNIERNEDMGGGSLVLFKQEDGDWIIRLVGRTLADTLTTCSIEFCTPMMGGGASPKTWAALEALAQAMIEDNAAPPRFGLRAEHFQANAIGEARASQDSTPQENER